MKNGKCSQEPLKQKDMAALSKPYLVLYNTVQTAGYDVEHFYIKFLSVFTFI